MSYLVICTFDLKNASREDYQNAYADLEKIGLKKVVVSTQNNKLVMPTTTTAGEFNGTSAATVRDHIADKVRSAFAARRFSSEIFVAVGGDWAWGARTT
jgi:hypothetical protein